MNGIGFDLTINIGHVITVLLFAGAAIFATYRKQIERAKDQEQNVKQTTLLQSTVERIADGQQDMRMTLSAVQSQGERTTAAMGALKDSVSDLRLDVGRVQGDLEGVKTTLAVAGQDAKEAKHATNDLAHRVTKLDTLMDVLRGGVGAPDAAVARAAAQARERQEADRLRNEPA